MGPFRLILNRDTLRLADAKQWHTRHLFTLVYPNADSSLSGVIKDVQMFHLIASDFVSSSHDDFSYQAAFHS